MSDSLDAIRGSFDERAPDYDESAMHRDLADAVAAFISLDGVETLLDVATGTGLVLRAVALRSTRVRLIGVDISPGMLGIARAKLSSAELHEADAAAMPVATASVDVLTCVTALHIIPNVSDSVIEWHRVLRDGGRLVTATFAAVAPGRNGPDRPYPLDHAPYASAAAIAESFAPLGFRQTRCTTWTDGNDTVLIAEFVAESTP